MNNVCYDFTAQKGAIGATDETVEGEWRSSSTQELMTYLPWYEEPDGGTEHNCSVMRPHGWRDLYCYSTRYAICEFEV